MLKTHSRLALAAVFAFAGTGAFAVPVSINNGNTNNGITSIYSTTFSGGLTPCGGGSPSYCGFFGGDPLGPQAIFSFPNPSGVNGAVPGAIAGPPAAGSFLDIDLTAGNTVAQIIGDSTISLPHVDLNIAGTTWVNTDGAGFVIKPSATAAINGAGQVEFLVDNSPGLAADFSTLGGVVTGCVGPLCALLGALTLDMVRYRLFLDFDPDFVHFTGSFIGQTANNSLVYANLSNVIPVPAAIWLMGSALGLLGWIRRKAVA